MINLTQHLSLSEIAEAYGVPYSTLRKWKIRSGVNEKRVATMIFIHRRDVNKILAVGEKK